MRQALDNFRHFDVHFLSPIQFRERDRIVLRIKCGKPEGAACSAGAYM